MKRALLMLGLLLVASQLIHAALPMWIQFSDAELQRDKQAAIKAMNSPKVWRRFPKYPHQRHYTPIVRHIDFCFYPPDVDKVTVVILTTHIGPRHRALIYVTFDHFGRILDMNEVPQI
jgi:hypothetical protein